MQIYCNNPGRIIVRNVLSRLDGQTLDTAQSHNVDKQDNSMIKIFGFLVVIEKNR